MVRPVRKKEDDLMLKYSLGILGYGAAGFFAGYGMYNLLEGDYFNAFLSGAFGLASLKVGKDNWPK